MYENLLQYINLTQVLVIITFLIVLIRHNPRDTIHRILIAILAVNLINEIIHYIYLIMNVRSSVMYTVNVMLHHCLWLYLLSRIAHLRQLVLYVMSGFIAFSVFNVTLLEGSDVFNFNTFIAGAILYVVLFIVESFRQLKHENLRFFTNDNYLLLCAPLLLFIGLSFIFGFKSRELSTTLVFGNVTLYVAIGYFVNIVYYLLINIYIFRHKKVSNGV